MCLSVHRSSSRFARAWAHGVRGITSEEEAVFCRPQQGDLTLLSGLRWRYDRVFDMPQSTYHWACRTRMRTLPRSLVLQRISSPLLFVLATTFVICVLNCFFTLPKVSSLAHTLLGSALGLLLVFRTNAAYDRFWEARKSWSTVTSSAGTSPPSRAPS